MRVCRSRRQIEISSAQSGSTEGVEESCWRSSSAAAMSPLWMLVRRSRLSDILCRKLRGDTCRLRSVALGGQHRSPSIGTP